MYAIYRCNSKGFQILRDSEIHVAQTVPGNALTATYEQDKENVYNSFYDLQDTYKYMSDKDSTNNSSTMPSAVPSASTSYNLIGDVLDDSDNDSRSDAGNTEQDLERARMGELCDGENLDSTLMEATSKAMACGSLMPLIKEELKLAIQTKRLRDGKSEMKVDFKTPEPYMLTEDEVEKVKKRRVQNREAARRFRERQKSKGGTLQKECQKLESQNTQLRYIASQLRDERNKLRARFQSHIRQCPYQPPQHFYQPTSSENDT